jgi:alkylation response protein AidB-like acyl-CoA dehydrogenase
VAAMNGNHRRRTAGASIREEVREVIAASGVPTLRQCDAWMRGYDPQFSKVLGGHRLIGITWPEELGGRAASNVERLVVTEELLRVGAPVAAHWIADRQIGPAILRHGSPALQREFLPRIARGEVTFCLGMSETEAGCDLAALRTKAVREGADFRITGHKIWTSHAHRSTHAYVLARTGEGGAKQEGLTEFIVDLASDGVGVRPILDLSGQHHFNETIFEDVRVPASNVIGELGGGWHQVTEQLAFERGGMERVLSTYPLLAAWLRDRAHQLPPDSDEDLSGLGTLIARLHTLRGMALDVARAMDVGEAPVQRAAMLKYLGTTFEGDVVEHVRSHVAVSPDPNADGIEGILAEGIFASPGSTLRGGTTEILLTILGRQEFSRDSSARPGASDELRMLMSDVLRRLGRSELGAPADGLWDTAVELGWTGINVPEASGGCGGTVHDLAVVASALARHGKSAPIVGTAIAGHVLAATGRTVDPSLPRALGLDAGLTLEQRNGNLVLNGTQTRVPWAKNASSVIVSAKGRGGEVLVELPVDAEGLSLQSGTNLAQEPRDTIALANVCLPTVALVGDQDMVARTRALVTVLDCAGIAGSLEAATDLAREHAMVRRQFGKPLAAFQAVAHAIARMATEVANTEAALAQGLAEIDGGGQGWRVVAAKIVASRAATAVAKSAHQVLGAMGITYEHDLHLATLRLWAWRDEAVPERTLARRLGGAVIRSGEEAMWNWCVHDSDRLTDDGRSPWRSI